MKTQRRQQTNIMLAVLLLLATILAPWTSVFAMPSDHESGMQEQSTKVASEHQSMDHANLSMDTADCCELEDCNDCEQDCSTCTVTPAIVVSATFIPNVSPAQDCQSANQPLFSNIPPPPNNPPV